MKIVVDVQIRGSIMVSISACHADDPGSIPGRGVFQLHIRISPQRQESGAQKNIGGFGSGLLHLTHCSNRTSSPTPRSSIYMSYGVACFQNDVLEACQAQVSESKFAFNHVEKQTRFPEPKGFAWAQRYIFRNTK